MVVTTPSLALFLGGLRGRAAGFCPPWPGGADLKRARVDAFDKPREQVTQSRPVRPFGVVAAHVQKHEPKVIRGVRNPANVLRFSVQGLGNVIHR